MKTGEKFFHTCCLSFAIGLVLLTSVAAFGQAESDPWLILGGGEKGPIGVHVSRGDLVRAYGASNVVDREVDVGEGATDLATILFPNDPERSIEILWKDPATKTAPRSATIRGEKSRWHAAHGISLGTSLSELQRLNGKPFPVSGYGTDQPGAILSWHHGLLERDLQSDGFVILRLNCRQKRGTPSPHLSLIEGDSDDPRLQKLGLYVDEINWGFPTPVQ